MYPEDPLPKMVCLECCSKLEQSYRFLESAHIAQMTLHRLFPIGEENCHNSELKEEECLVELLPLSTTPDRSLIHQVSSLCFLNKYLIDALIILIIEKIKI